MSYAIKGKLLSFFHLGRYEYVKYVEKESVALCTSDQGEVMNCSYYGHPYPNDYYLNKKPIKRGKIDYIKS
jgi:hypothetical protein